MSLKNVCAAFLNSRAPSLREVTPAIAVLGQKLAASAPAITQTPVLTREDLAAIGRRVEAALATGGEIARRDLRHAPWCLWGTGTPLADKPGRVEALLKRIEQNGRRRVLRALAAAYFYFFVPDRIGLATVGAFLARHAGGLGPSWLKLQQEFLLFDPRQGPARVLDGALRLGRTPDELLTTEGISDAGSTGGFRVDVYRLGFERLARNGNLEPLKRLGTIGAWILDGRAVRFEGLRSPAVSALLEPFGDSTPEKAMRDRFLELSLQLLGDPRSHGGRWSNCPRAESIARRWLTERSLRQFLEVVGRVAEQEPWKYREAFWHAVYREGYITDAWVVFDGNGAAAARRMFGNEMTFGVFGSTAGIQTGQAALILRVKNLLIAEWSHVGRCYVWDENSEKGFPRLYLRSYDRNDLVKPHKDESEEILNRLGIFRHVSPKNYTWQGRVAAYLRTKAGISIHQNNYVVRP